MQKALMIEKDLTDLNKELADGYVIKHIEKYPNNSCMLVLEKEEEKSTGKRDFTDFLEILRKADISRPRPWM